MPEADSRDCDQGLRREGEGLGKTERRFQSEEWGGGLCTVQQASSVL